MLWAVLAVVLATEKAVSPSPPGPGDGPMAMRWWHVAGNGMGVRMSMSEDV